jgi:hypothetical protein
VSDDTVSAANLRGVITTTRRDTLPVDREAVSDLISEVDAYHTWWSGLRTFEASGLAAGKAWRGQEPPPRPHPVRVRITIDHSEAPVMVRARITGDVVGTANLGLEDDADGCVACVSSSLAPGGATLRMVSRWAEPIARFGHDRVLDSGARPFISRAVTPALTG